MATNSMSDRGDIQRTKKRTLDMGKTLIKHQEALLTILEVLESGFTLPVDQQDQIRAQIEKLKAD